MSGWSGPSSRRISGVRTIVFAIRLRASRFLRAGLDEPLPALWTCPYVEAALPSSQSYGLLRATASVATATARYRCPQFRADLSTTREIEQLASAASLSRHHDLKLPL